MIYVVSACALVLLILLLRTRSALKQSEQENLKNALGLESLTQASQMTHEREVQRLLDVLPYVFFSISARGKIVRFNKNARLIFKQRDLLGRSIRQIFFDVPIVTEIEKALQKKEPFDGVFRLPPNSSFTGKSGKKDSFWELTLQPVSIESDTFEVQLMMRDITGNVETDQIRQDFVANASHELRTPLSILSGYLENLTEDGGLDNQSIANKMLLIMDRHVDRISHIVEEMLLISKLESGEETRLKLSDFNLAVCVRDIIERLDLVIEKQKARVLVEVPELIVNGDQFYWTQILFNLVENALKHNSILPVTITISAKQKKEGDLIVTVSDDGIGIPGSDLPFIFKRFFRVEKHHTQSPIRGTGLGLSIVKRAIEAHGGKIKATSSPGVETKFTIRAPQPPICDRGLAPD